MPDEARQADGAAVDERDAPAAAEHAEHGVARGDAEIAPQRELETAGDRVPFDRGDHRLREQHPRRTHRAVAVRLHDVAAAVGDGLEVGARAEVAARAGQDRDIVVIVAVERAERVGELGGGRRDRRRCALRDGRW